MTNTTRCTGVSVLFCCWQLAFSVCPAPAQTLTLVPAGGIDGPAELVQVQGKYAYVVADRTLRIFDVTNSSVPQRMGVFTFPEHVRAFSVSHSIVYVAADFFGIRIVDASNPAAPVLRGSLQIRGSLLIVALAGGNILVATNMVSGLEVVDVSDVSRPVLLTSNFFTDGYAQAVAASGPLAYVTDSANSLYLIDLSKPASPAAVSVQESTPIKMGSGDMPAVPSPLVAILETVASPSLKIALVLEKTTGFLHIHDVSNPRKPAKASSFRTPGRQQSLGVRGSRAYIGGAEGLQIVDFSDPSTPIPAGSFKMAGPVQDVALADSLVLVVIGKGGVVILHQRQ